MAAFTEAVGLTRFGMAGGDLGAWVLQAFSLRHAERLTGAFHFCTPYPGLGARYGQPDHLIEVWYQYFQQLPWGARGGRARIADFFAAGGPSAGPRGAGTSAPAS